MKKGKAYIENGDFVYDMPEMLSVFTYDHRWNIAFLYGDNGDEMEVTPYFPARPTLEQFEKAANDYYKARKGEIPYQLYRPSELKKLIQYEAVQMLREIPLEKQLTIN